MNNLIGKTFTRRDYLDPNGQQSKWYDWIIDEVKETNGVVDIYSKGERIYRFDRMSFFRFIKTGVVPRTSYWDDSTYLIH